MVMRLLGLREVPALDQSDALAAALAHSSRLRAPLAARAVKGVS
jgi:Holliday junction resolvasome RuvABC endonuclease subunit